MRLRAITALACMALRGLPVAAQSAPPPFAAVGLSADPLCPLAPGSGTVSSTSVSPSGTLVFQARSVGGSGSGDVLALPLAAAADGRTLKLDTAWRWSAATQLAATAPDSRNIVLGRASATASPSATALRWDALDPGQREALDRPAPAANADGLGARRLAWLRGDRAAETASAEGPALRRRASVLGSVVHGNLVFSGPPSARFTAADTAHQQFVAARAARRSAVFAEASDGMLHAFDADDGHELFAYVPGWLLPRLPLLAAPETPSLSVSASRRPALADGPITVAEARLASANLASDWRTVLVGGTGAGGRGVFALDVSDPAQFGPTQVLWEFTAADDADIGQVLGAPRVVQLRTSAAGAPARYGWYALVAGGVNSHVPDAAGRFSTTGQPTVFLLDLAKPAGTAWALGRNYFKLSLPVDALLARTLAPGVLHATPVLGPAGDMQRLYAGDLHGNLWSLDFSRASQGSAGWTTAVLAASGNTAPLPLFRARDAAGTPQPITVPPLAVRGGSRSTRYVVVGTGRWLEASDTASVARQSVYALFDRDGPPLADGDSTAAIGGRQRLRAGVVDASTGAVGVAPFRWGVAGTAATDVRAGWFFDLPAAGERQVSATAIVGNLLVSTTMAPGPDGMCSGAGRRYRVDVDTGNGTLQATAAFAGTPLLLAVPSATTRGAADGTGRLVRTTRTQLVDPGAAGTLTSTAIDTAAPAERLSWRQIFNYQALRHP